MQPNFTSKNLVYARALCYLVELDHPNNIWPSSGDDWVTSTDEDSMIHVPRDRLQVVYEEPEGIARGRRDYESAGD